MDWSLTAMLPLLLALGGGGLIAIQVGVNGALGKQLGSPVLAALASVIVSTIGLFLFVLIVNASSLFQLTKGPGFELPARSSLAQAPWWIWIGGLLGAGYLVIATTLAPRIGIGRTTVFVIAGQIVISLVVDHLGLFSPTPQPLNFPRLAGLLLMVAGVVLIKLY